MARGETKPTTTTSDAGAPPDSKPEPAPSRRLADWFDVPDLFRWFDTMRPMAFEDRMRVEEELRDSELLVRAELPGVDPDNDVEITVDNAMLRIHAERRKETREEAEGRVRSEFRYGALTRTISLPRGAKVDDIEASYRDGILEVHVPIGSPPEGGRIAVKRG